MEKQYSEADKELARALVEVNGAAAVMALGSGATAHKEPYKDTISWSLVPLYFKATQNGLSGDFTDAKEIMRNLIEQGSPIKGLAYFVGAGYPFSQEDIKYLLDNWLWKDADELKMVAARFLSNDDIMCQLIGTGQIDATLATPDGKTLFENICLNGLHRSAFELAGYGANVNQLVSLDGESMPVIEAAAAKGHAAVVNGLIKSGAFYDAENLIAKAGRHSPLCEAVVTKSIAAFEMGVDMSDEDVLLHMAGNQPKAV